MPTFVVSSVDETTREWDSANGKMVSYSIYGSLDGAEEEWVQINTVKSKPKVPVVGERIDCEVSKNDPQYGKTIKRVFKAPASSPGGHPEDPAKQAMIVRQNALGNAVQFMVAKATLEKKPDYLDTEKILTVALKFSAFSMGDYVPKKPAPPIVKEAEEEFAEES